MPALIKPERHLMSHWLDEFPLSEPAWMGALMNQMRSSDRVFIGNSLPIREMNLAVQGIGQGIEFFANRGANGIDGLVSTWLGASASSRSSWLVVGDLSALSDLAAPWIMPQLPQGNRRLVVINNGGGKIFSRISSLRSLPEDARQVIENNHRLTFAPWAEMWGLGYVLATKPEHLMNLPDGAVLVEVIPDAEQTEAFYAAISV
jgi:2-succinyl-5-enolpyruvyl-6-hydroxy-3-cyclohexene-1-carboxylate synthase